MPHPAIVKPGLTITQVITHTFTIGEGPYWEHDKHCLTFVDIKDHSLHRFFPRTGRWQQLVIEGGKTVSFVMPVVPNDSCDPIDTCLYSDLYVIGHGRSIALVVWPESDPDTHSRKVKSSVCEVECDREGNRFNDGKCDHVGRLWAGTMAAETAPGDLKKEKGHLYMLDSDLKLKTVLDKVSLSNGLDWSEDRKTFYYIDSTLYKVEAFDYKEETAEICNRRTILDFKSVGLDPDIPDGMCVDGEGMLWVACYKGAKVIRIDPKQNKIIKTIGLPAKNITSLCFGGDKHTSLYVTNACQCMSREEILEEGALGLIELSGLEGSSIWGVNSRPFKINVKALKSVLGV